MILRKPYAFLIKNFKRIHFIISILMGYLIYKSLAMLEYINTYINEGWLTNSNIVISDYMTLWTFVIIVVTIILLGIVLTLLINKKKPTLFYMISIVMLVGTIATYLLVLTDFNTILIEVIDARKIRITRDLLMIVTILQFVNVVFAVIRATGFNIKKFDFEKDLKEMDITAKDYEEIELTLKIDGNEIRRELRKRKRKLRYFILENLVAFIVLLVVGIVSLGVYIVLSVTIYNKVYSIGDSFKTTEGVMTVSNSYYTTVDYKGNDMSAESYGYLVVPFEVNNTTGEDTQLNTNNFVLFIEDEGYSPIKNKYVSMSDYGIGYSNQIIENGNTEKFFVVFEIPKDSNLEDCVFKYIDYYKMVSAYELETNYRIVNIEPNMVDEYYQTKTYSLNDEMVFNGTYFEGNVIKFTDYDFNIRYTEEGLVRADTLSEYDKILLRLEVESSGELDVANFIETYGTIQYINNGDAVTHKIPLVNKTPEGAQYIYIEVLESVKDSEKIYLVFRFREGTYTYRILDE